MNYWQLRMLTTQNKLTKKTIKETEEQLIKYYGRSMKKIIKQFEETYNNVILSVEDGKEPTLADLYKLDKYWQMQNQLQQELQKLGEKQISLLGKIFTEQYLAIYNSIQINNLKENISFVEIDRATAEQMINSIWCADGKSWSQRIWTNTDRLQEALNAGLIECLITGKKTSELKNILQEQFNVGYNRADALVRTELAHIQTESAKKRYQDYGIQEVEIWADADERRCEVCGKLHKTRYPINAAVPIPAHPRCRCCIVPVVE